MTETTMRIRVRELRPGDFLDEIHGAILRGPRGGKYRLDGVLVQSRVVRCGVDLSPGGRGRFGVTPASGPAFYLPGNSHEMLEATVRRTEATDVRDYGDDDLLAALESPVRAVRLAAEAEAERRTATERSVR